MRDWGKVLIMDKAEGLVDPAIDRQLDHVLDAFMQVWVLPMMKGIKIKGIDDKALSFDQRCVRCGRICTDLDGMVTSKECHLADTIV